jgi:NAD(P)H-hydrate epimerase
MYENDPAIAFAQVTPGSIAPLFAPRPRDSNKGKYGHVLIVAGSRGKSGAAAMSGVAALRAGAGLVTIACPESALGAVASHAPELMTEPLPETHEGAIASAAFDRIGELAEKRTLVAIGPGIGTGEETKQVVNRLFTELAKPMVIDADALNCLAGGDWTGTKNLRVLTPHPGEMSRLNGQSIAEIQRDRRSAARAFAGERRITLVLKGEGTLIAFGDGRVWVNPTGSPSMATGGTGDILTGMIAGLLGQFPSDPDRAVAGAVYLHGLAGEIAARHLTEQSVIATDLLRYLPEGIREIADAAHAV